MAKGSLVSCVFFFFSLMSSFSAATVYKVGGESGWTVMGDPVPDYQTWSSTKNFQVGDIIVFEYNAQFHNVMQVSNMDWISCNATAPRNIYNTGNDSITITKKGHWYFICGVPGHCQMGQKVDIRAGSSSANAPAAAAPPTSSTTTPSPTSVTPPHSPNSASSSSGGFLAVIVTSVASLVLSGGLA